MSMRIQGSSSVPPPSGEGKGMDKAELFTSPGAKQLPNNAQPVKGDAQQLMQQAYHKLFGGNVDSVLLLQAFFQPRDKE